MTLMGYSSGPTVEIEEPKNDLTIAAERELKGLSHASWMTLACPRHICLVEKDSLNADD